VVVLDATVVVEGLVRAGPSRMLLSTERFHVPYLADCELLSALTRMTRKGELEPSVTDQALSMWPRLGVRRHPVTGLLDRMWELRENVTAYDSSYVALAEWLEIPLVTRDKRLSRAPGIRCEVRLIED
jgi:predicted nucleic acid-binding protein